MRKLWRRLLHLIAPAGIFLGWKQLAADKKRLFTAIAGVTFGTMLMLFQLGLYNAINTMVVLPHFNLEGELVMTSPDFEYFGSSRQFTRRRLVQAASLPEVRAAAPVYIGFVYWQNPQTGTTKTMFAMAIDPDNNPFTIPAIRAQAFMLHDPEAVLFDALSQSSYGPVVSMFSRGPVETDIDQRHSVVRGLYEMGPTLAASASVVISDENYFRFRPDRRNMPDVGMISLQPGADPERVAARLRAMLPHDVRIQTRDQFIAAERLYWNNRTPIGFVVTAGMLVGMFVGGIVVYQILYTDVNDHLKEYATLKAMGLGDGFFVGLILQEALILVSLSFLPALALTMWIDRMARERVNIPAELEPAQALFVLAAVSVMCLFAGQLATHRLRSADPASVF
jgi:putative ABC transport system permease protein